ncbi:FAD-binding oxidoreductase [Crenothrix sp.]|uniref:FAD-binding oxidoreductase n=1 Tax=Crenothrix sp. TaxID=3100433 RepID=UPI00374C98E2
MRFGSGSYFWADHHVTLGDKLRVFKSGSIVHEIPLDNLGSQTVIGRHPDADLQLESHKMAMFHALIRKVDGKLYIENLDSDSGILIKNRKLSLKTRVQLRDGMQIDMPGFRLEFAIANMPNSDELDFDAEELLEIPDFFYQPPPPAASPLLSNLVDNLGSLKIWSEGTSILKVADIIEETADCKTFRLVGKQSLLFSYKPGQFITFILNLDGKEVKRSYSMSSSPSRPHLLEVTIKRVPGGLVSNWFCDHVKLGDELIIKGLAGKFTCFNYPSSKMLFVGAGSGITPLLSMSRWIADTASDVDVKLLGSFKSPPDIIFRKEFEMLSARNRGFQVAISVTSGWHGSDFWTGFTGRVNHHMLNLFVPDLHERDVFLCGPEPFADNVKNILRDLNYDMARFHTESFGSGRSAQQSGTDVSKILQLKGMLHKVTFAKSGKTVETDGHTTLLALAEAHGIEIDYSCRIGSCGECEVKCNGNTYALPDCGIDEKTRAAGFIYTCCSMATSDVELLI